jgi:heme-degrading monooxygenase HmoA
MIIVAGYELLDPRDRDRYVEAFRDFVHHCRTAPGCRDVAVTADSVDPRRVNTFELWDSQEDVDAWRATARVPDVDIDVQDAQVMEYEVNRSKEPFS